jgi:hypothetical protein
MCSEEQCTHNGAEKSLYKKNSKLFGFVEQSSKREEDDYEIYRPAYNEKKGSISFYKLSCGHIQVIRRQHFNDSKYRCSVCIKEKRIAHANFSGFIYHGVTDHDADISRYECPSGHVVNLASHSVQKYFENGQRHSCYGCILEERYSAASRNNLELIDAEDSSKWMYREYRFKNCGHTQKIKTSEVAKDNIPECVECRWENNIKMAAEQGVTLLRTGENNESADVILPCGCERKLRVGNLVRGIWSCKNHSNYYSKSSYLYVIKIEFENVSFIKVGITSNPSRRFREYGISKACNISTTLLHKFSSTRDSLAVEKYIHKKFKTGGEYRRLAKQYVPSGHTECYSVSLEDEILSEVHVQIKSRGNE